MAHDSWVSYLRTLLDRDGSVTVHHGAPEPWAGGKSHFVTAKPRTLELGAAKANYCTRLPTPSSQGAGGRETALSGQTCTE